MSITGGFSACFNLDMDLIAISGSKQTVLQSKTDAMRSERKGSINQLPEHRKQESGDWIEIMERLRSKWNCYDFQHFINGIKKEKPRHISKQLRAIEQFLDAENPDKSLVAQVMKECCQKYRYQFSQFKVVYSLAKAGRELANDDCRAQIPSGSVVYTDPSVYAKAFRERTERKGAAVQ